MPRALTERRLIHAPLAALLVVLALLLTALAATIPASADDSYHLYAGDAVHVRVVGWRPVDTSLQDWSAIDGDYAIDPSGNIAFPFIGETKGAGKTTGELAAKISAGLRQTLGLTTAPDVTVEVAGLGPVYITGAVKTPGKYPFVPGLDVIKAVSLAGGESTNSDYNTPTEHDLITLQGAYQVMQDQHLRLQITRARLDAELANQSAFSLPPDVAGDPKAAELATVEKSVMTADEAQVTSQIAALKTQTDTLTSELSVLKQKNDSTAQQVTIAQNELNNFKSLAGRGLATNDSVATAARELSDLEVQSLDIETDVLQAQQAMGQAQQQSAQIVSKHSADLTLQRQQTDQQIFELELKLATQKQLLANAAAYVAQNGPASQVPTFSYSYSIMRGAQQQPASLSDTVQPGDVVVVKVQIGG